MSFSVFSLIHADPRRPFEPPNPEETEEPPVEITTEPPEEGTTTEETPPIETDPPVTITDPFVTDPEPPVTDDTTEETETPPIGSEEIQLNFYQSTLEEGEGVQLLATLINSTAADPVITFYSSNTAVVRVDASGYIIATGAGEAEVVAYYGNVMASAKITVVAPTIEPKYIILSSRSFSLNIGGIAKIEAALLPTEISNDYYFTYESLNTAVAEVGEDGVITAIGEGETEIIVRAADLSEKISVIVTKEAVIHNSKIDGFLYNTKGEPMAGSIIYMDGQTATVDKNGHFSFDAVDQKKIMISVSDYPEIKCEYTVLKDATIYLLSQDSLLTMLPTLGELQGRLPISEVSFDSPNIILNEGDV
ncbi:MAG: Ig-like domain-containing protein, partial [Ruminiclostridium sp.]|nr:Ig-like domain-containing protein [Ruminiclostridium sp.]